MTQTIDPQLWWKTNAPAPLAVLQEVLYSGMRALKLTKGVTDKLHPENWHRWALLHFESSTLTLVALRPPSRISDLQSKLEFHAFQIPARSDRTIDICVDYWTLKEVIEQASPERIDFSFDYRDGANGERIPVQLIVTQSLGIQRTRLPIYSASEYPFNGEITHERAESSDGFLTWHEVEIKPYKKPKGISKRRGDTHHAIYTDMQGITHSRAYAGASVLDWVTRDQARRLVAKQVEDGERLVREIHNTLHISMTRTDIDFRPKEQNWASEYLPLKPMACIDKNGDLVIRTRNDHGITTCTIFHCETDHVVFGNETVYASDGYIQVGFKTRLETTFDRQLLINFCWEFDRIEVQNC